MIPYGRQSIGGDDIAAVIDVLQSDFLTQGPAVPRFEARLCAVAGARYAVAANSGTSALHLACRALGVGPGDRVWTVPITFVASANAALYCGAGIDFVDVDPETANISVASLEARLTAAARDRRLPKALIVVHFAGQPCEMARIGPLAARHGVRVIEDASHALGARDGPTPIGAGEHSAITVFSFHPVKPITTGEGGAAVTNDPTLARTMARLRTHGITRETAEMAGESHGPWYYEQLDLGFNYRLTDLQAALGEAQLRRLDSFIDRRAALAARYHDLLRGTAARPLTVRPDIRHGWHLFVVRVDGGSGFGPDRRRAVFEGMRARGIGVNVHYIPVHLQPHYRRLGFARGDFPAAEAYYDQALTLPLFPALTEADQDAVVRALGECLG